MKIDYEATPPGHRVRKIIAYEGDKAVGSLTVDRAQAHYNTGHGSQLGGQLFEHDYDPPTIDLAKVLDTHQRQGIGTAMHAIAEAQFGQTVHHSNNISPAAFSWANKNGGKVPVEGPTGSTFEVNRISTFTGAAGRPEHVLTQSTPQQRAPRERAVQPQLPFG